MVKAANALLIELFRKKIEAGIRTRDGFGKDVNALLTEAFWKNQSGDSNHGYFGWSCLSSVNWVILANLYSNQESWPKPPMLYQLNYSRLICSNALTMFCRLSYPRCNLLVLKLILCIPYFITKLVIEETIHGNVSVKRVLLISCNMVL